MKEVGSIEEFFLETRGGRPPLADLSIYDGKLYDCGCGKKHEFFWKDGPHLKKQSYSPIATYVLRELRGMRFVFSMTHCHYHNLVKINFLGNFKTLITFRHGDPQASIRDYEERFFERAGVKNPMKKHYPKNKEIKEVNTKAKPPEFSSKTKKSTKKKPTKTKKVVKKKTTTKKQNRKTSIQKLEEIDRVYYKSLDKYSKALNKYLEIEKEYVKIARKHYKMSLDALKKTNEYTKKDLREIINVDIETFEDEFKKTNKASYSYLDFLKKLKSEI